MIQTSPCFKTQIARVNTNPKRERGWRKTLISSLALRVGVSLETKTKLDHKRRLVIGLIVCGTCAFMHAARGETIELTADSDWFSVLQGDGLSRPPRGMPKFPWSILQGPGPNEGAAQVSGGANHSPSGRKRFLRGTEEERGRR